jgi:hypothetical protein
MTLVVQMSMQILKKVQNRAPGIIKGPGKDD